MTLYNELGGEPAIRAALDRFYEQVLADQRLATYFEGVPLPRLKEKQAAFFTMAFGGPNGYDGRDLRTAHDRARRHGLDDETVDLFLGYFRSTLEEFGVGEAQVAQVMALAEGGRGEVLAR